MICDEMYDSCYYTMCRLIPNVQFVAPTVDSRYKLNMHATNRCPHIMTFITVCVPSAASM